MSKTLFTHVRVLELQKDFGAALELLETNAKMRTIIDPLAVMETRARLLSNLGKIEDADMWWRQLMDLNPDCDEYYVSFMINHGIKLGG